jgi:hypothetical protein
VITTPLVNALDIIATFAFALVGARVAAAKSLDYGGIFPQQPLPPSLVEHLEIFLRPANYRGFSMPGSSEQTLALLVTVATKTVKPWAALCSRSTLGVWLSRLFPVQTMQFLMVLALLEPLFSPFSAAVLGGLLRDLFCQVEPVLLHRETIGTSCLAGALLYVTLEHFSISECDLHDVGWSARDRGTGALDLL